MSEGEEIRAAREAKGWSQAEVAKRVGTTQQTVDRLERGQTTHSRALGPVREALGLPAEARRETGRQPTTVFVEFSGHLPVSVAAKVLALLDGAE